MNSFQTLFTHHFNAVPLSTAVPVSRIIRLSIKNCRQTLHHAPIIRHQILRHHLHSTDPFATQPSTTARSTFANSFPRSEFRRHCGHSAPCNSSSSMMSTILRQYEQHSIQPHLHFDHAAFETAIFKSHYQRGPRLRCLAPQVSFHLHFHASIPHTMIPVMKHASIEMDEAVGDDKEGKVIVV